MHDLVVADVEAGDGEIGFRGLRFLLDAYNLPGWVELHHAVPLRIPHPVAEDHRSPFEPTVPPEDPLESVPVEDVVAQNQAHTVFPDELLPDDKRLRKALRAWLNRVRYADPPLGPVPEEV